MTMTTLRLDSEAMTLCTSLQPNSASLRVKRLTKTETEIHKALAATPLRFSLLKPNMPRLHVIQ